MEREKSLGKLLRFLFWYGAVVAMTLVVLPRAAMLVESYYEAMSSAVRLSIVIGFVALVAAWHLVRTRSHSN
jgi:hypothetical protein